MSLALTQAVKALAEGLGFHAVGIAFAHDLRTHLSYGKSAYERFLRWIEEGKQAGMHYLVAGASWRASMDSLLEGARSVIIVLQSYFHTARHRSPIAQYAWGEDYHIHMRRRLQIIADYLMKRGYPARPFVDTAPVLEKVWAVLAGLGWIGKNTLLLNRRLGSYTFIGGVVTQAELLPDPPFLDDLCGSCQRCIEACPTNALMPYQLDARLCIAYWTIEAPALEEGMPATHGWLFGCDICQQVCPWNRFARVQGEIAFRPKAVAFLPIQGWAALTHSQIKKHQQRSALRRAHPRKLIALAQRSLPHTKPAETE